MGRDISVYPKRAKIHTCIHSQLERIVIFSAFWRWGYFDKQPLHDMLVARQQFWIFRVSAMTDPLQGHRLVQQSVLCQDSSCNALPYFHLQDIQTQSFYLTSGELILERNGDPKYKFCQWYWWKLCSLFGMSESSMMGAFHTHLQILFHLISLDWL